MPSLHTWRAMTTALYATRCLSKMTSLLCLLQAVVAGSVADGACKRAAVQPTGTTSEGIDMVCVSRRGGEIQNKGRERGGGGARVCSRSGGRTTNAGKNQEHQAFKQRYCLGGGRGEHAKGLTMYGLTARTVSRSTFCTRLSS